MGQSKDVNYMYIYMVLDLTTALYNFRLKVRLLGGRESGDN